MHLLLLSQERSILGGCFAPKGFHSDAPPKSLKITGCKTHMEIMVRRRVIPCSVEAGLAENALRYWHCSREDKWLAQGHAARQCPLYVTFSPCSSTGSLRDPSTKCYIGFKIVWFILHIIYKLTHINVGGGLPPSFLSFQAYLKISANNQKK